MANGTYWWRVRTVDAAGHVSKWSGGRSVKVAWTAAPSLNVVGNANTIVYPTTPATLSWTPVPLATKYLVSVSLDNRLSSLVDVGAGANAVETTATTFTIPRLLAPGRDYYWGVTPVDAEGHHGLPSTVGHFTWTWPSTTTTHPVTDFGDLSLLQAGELAAPTFSWDPVPGAVRYEVEVNAGDSSFPANSKVCCSDTVTTNSLTPVAIFENNTFNWRAGHRRQWRQRRLERRLALHQGVLGRQPVGGLPARDRRDPARSGVRELALPATRRLLAGRGLGPGPGAQRDTSSIWTGGSPLYGDYSNTALSFQIAPNSNPGVSPWGGFGPSLESLPALTAGSHTLLIIPRADSNSVLGTPSTITFDFAPPTPAASG